MLMKTQNKSRSLEIKESRSLAAGRAILLD